LDLSSFLPFYGFYLGPIYVHAWGLTAALGVITAAGMAFKKAGNQIPENKFWNLVIILIILIFLGARAGYALEHIGYYSLNPLSFLRIWEGGFSFSGGAIGGILAGYVWSKINKADFLFLGWLFTPAWLFGLFFGRIGCFLIQDHLGKPTDLPWGTWINGAYRHEPALYESIMVLIIGVLLSWNFLRRLSFGFKHPRDFFFPASLLLYSTGRFLLDFLRADDPLYFNLTLAQWASVTIFTVTGAFLLIKNKKAV